MGPIVVVVASVMGFFGGIALFAFSDASALTALSVWLLSGPVAGALLIAAGAGSLGTRQSEPKLARIARS